MKIAISSDGPDTEACVSRRFGTSPYFLIADVKTGKIEVLRNPAGTGQGGAGAQAVVLLLSRDVGALLTGYCNPAMRQRLEENGVKVFSGLSGVARDLLREYRTGGMERGKETGIERGAWLSMVSGDSLADAARRSWNQVLSMLPIMAGVVLLLGLFNSFVPGELLASIFSGNAVLDTLWGACAGSVFAGNPVNSYIIGGELLKQGVSLFGVTALMLTWITVGLVQLPAEMAALGPRFAILRNIACFLLAFPIAIATVLVLTAVTGGPS